MTQKHFVATAKIISQIKDPKVRKQVAQDFAVLFHKENPRFSGPRFLAAAGVE